MVRWSVVSRVFAFALLLSLLTAYGSLLTVQAHEGENHSKDAENDDCRTDKHATRFNCDGGAQYYGRKRKF